MFIGYYSRHNRPSQSELIKAYGSKANIANGLAGATFDLIPLSPTAFAPLFPGSVVSTPPENSWMFDPVWPQAGVCLDSNASAIFPCPDESSQRTQNVYQHFMADDYTWAGSDGTYFYYAWCDRSLNFTSGGHSRPDANIRFGKVKQ